MVIIVKRAQALMHPNLQSKSLCDPLNGKVAELLKFKLIHSHSPLRYSSVFEYNPVWFE